jgi:ribosomal-protein-alanine N-acetyltransferase
MPSTTKASATGRASPRCSSRNDANRDTRAGNVPHPPAVRSDTEPETERRFPGPRQEDAISNVAAGAVMSEAIDPWADGLPTLPGTRIRLRALEPRDAPAQVVIYGDPEVRRYGYAPPMESDADGLAVVENAARLARERTIFHWCVASTEDDVAIGHATLFHLETTHRRAEIGYSLRRDLWGRGLVSEAVGVLLEFAFDRLDLHRVEADVDPRNLGSLRVLEKHGFVREGYLRERWQAAGGEVDDGVFLGLLRREWTGLAARPAR